MLTKSILAVAAIALVATIGSASAGEQFSSIEGIPAVPMSIDEQDATVGAFGFSDPSSHGSPASYVHFEPVADVFVVYIPDNIGTDTAIFAVGGR